MLASVKPILVVLFLVISFVYVQGSVADTVCDEMVLGKSDTITGVVGQRFRGTYVKDISTQDIEHLVSPFRDRSETHGWQSEFWGKWFTSAVLAYRYRPTSDLKKKLAYAVDALLSTQSDDGYIGNYAKTHRLHQWDIWGRKYTMLGLIAYHELVGDKRSLMAACRVADHLMAELDAQDGVIVTKGNYRGMAASSVLEPICLLYNHTKEKKYLDFAEEIVRQWEESGDGPKLISKATVDVAARFPKPDIKNWYSPQQGQKAYEMMSCYEGLLELYRITGRERYKTAVEAAWENIHDTEINLAGSGASAEMWFGGRALQTRPVFHYQETCVTVTWIKLSHQLLRLTGESKYADAVERAFYNALLGSFSPIDYTWAKYTPLVGERLPGSGQCGMNLNCCEASGPRGLFNMPSHILMSTSAGVSINYYVPGEFHVIHEGRPVRFSQVTDYPVDGSVRIYLELEEPSQFEVLLRIPEWSDQTLVKVNGSPVQLEHSGYVVLDRKWKTDDIIELELDMRGRLAYQDGHFAVMRGPILLARDSRLPGPHLTTTIQPVLDNEGFLKLSRSPHKHRNTWMEFSAQFLPESYTEYGADPISVNFCDYASAGYDEKKVVYQVWMPELQDPRE